MYIWYFPVRWHLVSRLGENWIHHPMRVCTGAMFKHRQLPCNISVWMVPGTVNPLD